MLYLLLSAVAIVVLAFQNMGGDGVYCVGSYGCQGPSVAMMFTFKIIYVLFWTWLLNVVCKAGYETVSWILVLLPFLLMFIFIAMVFATHFPATKYLPW